MGAALTCLLFLPRFGSLPKGMRKERAEQSPNYRNGMFRNLEPTPLIAKNATSVMLRYLLSKKPADLRPSEPIQVRETDLRKLDHTKNQVVWLGHSCLFIIAGGRTILVDPAIVSGAPLHSLNPPFRYTREFTPDDIPVVDCLLITHDHWDHLDYLTIKKLHHRIIRIVCPLGVGQHFEKWGFENDQIIELDWWQSSKLWNDTEVTCTPARHFSGRGLKRNQSLWASYMITTGDTNIFISGDTGYGTHFSEIARRFTDIDLAIIENGQYSENWPDIHTLPYQLEHVITDLKPKKAFTVHHSRFALASHPWTEPLENAKRLKSEQPDCAILTPDIGEPVIL